VQLTGLNTKTFETGIDNLQMLHVMLARQIPEGLMEQYDPSSYLQYSSIDLGTRYFTARQDDPLGTAIPFHPNVDPKGLLSSIATDISTEKTIRFSIMAYRLISAAANHQGE
jgi:hypothetical protein